MSTYVYDHNGQQVAYSRNLRAMLHAAAQYGVVSVSVSPSIARPGAASVCAKFVNGYRAETLFMCPVHAANWAKAKSKRKGSGWTDCTVEVKS